MTFRLQAEPGSNEILCFFKIRLSTQICQKNGRLRTKSSHIVASSAKTLLTFLSTIWPTDEWIVVLASVHNLENGKFSARASFGLQGDLEKYSIDWLKLPMPARTPSFVIFFKKNLKLLPFSHRPVRSRPVLLSQTFTPHKDELLLKDKLFVEV